MLVYKISQGHLVAPKSLWCCYLEIDFVLVATAIDEPFSIFLAKII